MLVPKLRFKREDGTDFPEWEEKRIGEILTLCHGKNYKHLKKGDIPVMGTGGVITYVNEALCDWQCVCIGRKGTIDRSYFMDKPFWSVDTLFYSKPLGDNMPNFQYYLFQNINWLFYNEASGVPSLSASTIENIIVKVPTVEEQQKIADFLSTVDEVIAQSEAEVANLQQQKKAAMQKIFSQEVRFKREDGTSYPEWEELSMSEIFKEIIEKNRPDLPVLSILQGKGTVYRDNSDRNIMYDKKSTGNYKAMRKGDFIIHLRTFEGGLECATLDGISSPAYKILRTDKLIPEAYKAYFRSKQFIEGRLAIAVTGVRDGKNIEMSTFWQILVPVPCLEEQQKIADFLATYDEAISCAKQELDKWKELKKGLLQQMFA